MKMIFVKILNEDVDVWRPVYAEESTTPDVYHILAYPINRIPPGEVWEFNPGSTVKVREKISEGESIWVAYVLVQ